MSLQDGDPILEVQGSPSVTYKQLLVSDPPGGVELREAATHCFFPCGHAKALAEAEHRFRQILSHAWRLPERSCQRHARCPERGSASLVAEVEVVSSPATESRGHRVRGD